MPTIDPLHEAIAKKVITDQGFDPYASIATFPFVPQLDIEGLTYFWEWMALFHVKSIIEAYEQLK